MTRSVLWTLAAWCSLGGAAAHSDVPIAIAYPEYLAVYSLTEEGSHILSILDGGDEAFNETSLEFMVVPSSSADLEGLEEAEAASASGACDWLCSSIRLLVLQRCSTCDQATTTLLALGFSGCLVSSLNDPGLAPPAVFCF